MKQDGLDSLGLDDFQVGFARITAIKGELLRWTGLGLDPTLNHGLGPFGIRRVTVLYHQIKNHPTSKILPSLSANKRNTILKCGFRGVLVANAAKGPKCCRIGNLNRKIPVSHPLLFHDNSCTQKDFCRKCSAAS